jgi:septum formation protein
MSGRPPLLLLCSTSPRRRTLLEQHGFAYRVLPPAIDDAGMLKPDALPAHQWPCALAYLKARSAAGSAGALPVGAVLLGADTIVVKDGRIIGQPADESDAQRIIRLLRNGSHTVLTGVALLAGGAATRRLLVDQATVTVGDIPDDELRRYIDSGGWRGKAGAYNLSERLAAGWPISFRGDPATVMGLPMAALAPILRRTATGVD